MEVYKKINPFIFETLECENDPIDKQIKTSSNDSNAETSEVFMINESLDDNDAMLANEEGEEYLVTAETDKSQIEEQEYEDLYLEYEDQEETEDDSLVVEQPPQDEDRKQNFCSHSSHKGKSKNAVNRKSYTVEKKLEIIEHAEKHNNRVTARFFDINESSVRCFRRQKEMLLKMSPQKMTNRRAFPHWPKLESELKQYVINHPNEHGTKAKLKEIKKEAIQIAAKQGIENFNGSNSYIFKFMQRHQLPSASPRPRKNRRTETPKKS